MSASGCSVFRWLLPSSLLILPFGCKPSSWKSDPVPATSRAKATSPTDVVTQVRDKVQQVVTGAEMKELHLFLDAASAVDGRLPDPSSVTATVAREHPKLGQLLKDGFIVLTGIRQREGVWAYERDAAEKGGWIIDQSGARQVTAAEFKQLVPQKP